MYVGLSYSPGEIFVILGSLSVFYSSMFEVET